MKRKLITLPLIAIVFTSLILIQCDCPRNDPPVFGKIAIKFQHFYDGDTVDFDKMKYKNAFGNDIEISEIQYFISDVTLHKTDGDSIMIKAMDFAHYIDNAFPNTLLWNITDKIDTGSYESISFTFGIKGEKNKPYMFLNYPESDMIWPILLGGDSGGYHYMKLNGFWLNTLGKRSPFNFHLGVGQKQDSNGVRLKDSTGSYIFVQNWFEVKLANSAFRMQKDHLVEVSLVMNIEEWWKNPTNWDFNYWGGDIMENQKAMNTAAKNGRDVFEVKSIKE